MGLKLLGFGVLLMSFRVWGPFYGFRFLRFRV